MTLRYTGHPIADVGVATICAFREKPDPSVLTDEDLLKVAQFLEHEYFSGKLKAFLSVMFPNSLPFQADITPRYRQRFVDRYRTEVLRAFQAVPEKEAVDLSCTFCAQPAVRLAYRQHVPMITGETVFNFFPAGLGGMPICGACLLAVQAFPLGSRRCHGRALAAHCPDDPSVTYEFARHFLADNRKLLLLAQKSGDKYEDAKAPRTLVIDALITIGRRRADWSDLSSHQAPSISVYHLTNTGRGLPDIKIFELPSQVVAFVALASRAGLAGVWNGIVARAWENTVRSTGSKREASARARDPEKAAPPQAGKNRNFLYEDLFALPDNCASFVRKYLLRRAWKEAGQSINDRPSEFPQSREIDLVSWTLTHLFLKEVLGMDKARIEAIRTLGDRLAGC